MSEATPSPSETPKKRRRGCWIALGVVLVLCGGGSIWFGPVIRDFYKRGFFDSFLNPQEKHQYSANSEENLKAIYRALMLFHDSEGQFPEASKWMDSIQNRIRTNDLAKGEAEKKLIRPDLLSQPGKYGYAMNDAASGKYKDDIKDPSKTPLIYESTDTEKNAHGTPQKGLKGIAIAVDGTILK